MILRHMGYQLFFLSDGPHGMRTQEGQGDWLGINKSKAATCFPTAATIANSWDPELAGKLRQHWERKQSLLE